MKHYFWINRLLCHCIIRCSLNYCLEVVSLTRSKPTLPSSFLDYNQILKKDNKGGPRLITLINQELKTVQKNISLADKEGGWLTSRSAYLTPCLKISYCLTCEDTTEPAWRHCARHWKGRTNNTIYRATSIKVNT